MVMAFFHNNEIFDQTWPIKNKGMNNGYNTKEL